MLVYNGKPGSSRNWDLYPWCCLPKESNIKNKTKQDDAEGLKLPSSVVGVSPVQPSWETQWRVFGSLETQLSYDPDMPTTTKCVFKGTELCMSRRHLRGKEDLRLTKNMESTKTSIGE